MPAEENAHRRLRDALRVRAEQGIGPAGALRYAREREGYAELRDRIVTILDGLRCAYRPTVHEVADVCESTEPAMNMALYAAGNERAADDEHRRGMENIVVPASEHSFLFDLEPTLRDLGYRFWFLDYRPFLIGFCQRVESFADRSVAFREAFSEQLYSEEPILKAEDGERWISYPEFCASDECTLRGAPPSVERWGRLQYNLGRFQTWLRDGQDAGSPYGNVGSRLVTRGALALLYPTGGEDGVYARAKKEGTLGRIDVERRVALAALLTQTDGETGIEVAQRGMEAALQTQRDTITKADAFSARFAGLLTPPQTAAANAREREEAVYTLRAFQENREWLLRMLSE